VRHVRDLGFTIREVAKLVTLSGSRARHKDLRRMVDAKRAELVIEVERATRALAECDQMIAAATAQREAEGGQRVESPQAGWLSRQRYPPAGMRNHEAYGRCGRSSRPALLSPPRFSV
jgi:DNA-binding transcriptional MerR regulator